MILFIYLLANLTSIFTGALLPPTGTLQHFSEWTTNIFGE